MRTIILFLMITSCIYGCEGFPIDPWGIWVKNNSNDTVMFYINFKKISDKEYHYSTLFPDSFNDTCMHTVPPQTERPWDFYYYRYVKYSNRDTLSIYVFSPDTLRKYTAKEIGQNNNYLKMFKTYKGDGEIVYP